jgi:heme-degrading monooxygenase HmoA
MVSPPLRLVALVVLLLASASVQIPFAGEKAAKVHQLRVYEIFEHNKAAFHERFRDHAVRIMRRHGFTILSMWESKSETRTEFVYLLEWPDESAMKAGWTAFMSDKEWADIKERTRGAHGVLVGEIQDRILRATDYSPR